MTHLYVLTLNNAIIGPAALAPTVPYPASIPFWSERSDAEAARKVIASKVQGEVKVLALRVGEPEAAAVPAPEAVTVPAEAAELPWPLPRA